MSKLLILGAGGYGHVIMEAAIATGKYDMVSFLDDSKQGVLGICDDFERFLGEYECAYPAFGANMLRLQWITRLEAAGFVIESFLHPCAYVSPSAVIGKGAAVLANATVSAGAVLDSGVIVNCAAVADHHCHLHEGVHLAPGAVVKAGAVVERLFKVESGQVIFAER